MDKRRFGRWRSRRRRAALCATILSGLLLAPLAQRPPTRAAESPLSDALHVETEIARSTSRARTITAIAALRAVRETRLAPEVAGRIVRIRFEPGERVAQGAALVELNSAPQQAEIARFRADQTLAAAQLRRSIALSRMSVTTRAELDERQAAQSRADAAVARLEAEIELRTIRAPYSGVVGVRRVYPGQYLREGELVAVLTDLDRVLVDFSVPQRELAGLAVGQQITFETDAVPGRRFEARLATIDPQVAAETRNVLLEAEIDNRDHALRPGLSGSAILTLSIGDNALTIPDTAIVPTAATDTVFVLRQGPDADDGDAHVEQVAIKVGAQSEGRVVVEAGLAHGDEIVTGGQNRLADGMPVRPSGRARVTRSDAGSAQD